MTVVLQKPGKHLSVTQLVHLLNGILDRYTPQLAFQAEISKITRAGSGHLYLDLKDERSQIAAVMWRGSAQDLTFEPQAGMAVVCYGKPSIYHARGQLQVVLHRIQPAGEGILQQQFLKLKAKLEAEGLFDQERKRPLPFLPRAIGVVTSAGGAVIHDIMVKIRERMPSQKVYLFDARVQGPGAVDELVQGIEAFNSSAKVDVIIVARGGGSLEDLWPFNEEKLVRAIFASRIPVISGVGHEVDVTLADMVADLRAPTPTAAAEMVVPHCKELLRQIEQLELRFSDIERWMSPIEQRLDDLEQRLQTRVKSVFDQNCLLLKAAIAKLRTIRPDRVVEIFQAKVSNFASRIVASGNRSFVRQLVVVDSLGKNLLQASRTQVRLNLAAFKELAGRYHSLDPRRVLQRGYALAYSDKTLVRSIEQLDCGQQISIAFFDGRAEASVLRTAQLGRAEHQNDEC